MSGIDEILKNVPVPPVVRIRQTFERPVLADPPAALKQQLAAKKLLAGIRPGQRIAIAVGSRGITGQPALVAVLGEAVRAAGGEPFLVPAMGSHGGATAEGQERLLRDLGLGDEIPIRSSMETVVAGTAANGLPVRVDRLAWSADGIILINRIKPHIGFRGPYESGLMKMVAIGLGKQPGAEITHNLGFGQMAANIPAMGRVVLASGKVLAAVALLENAYHETCRLEALAAAEVEAAEPPLLEEAKRRLPSFPVEQLDVLVIDEIGKNISGAGIDNNIVGRYHTPYASGGPKISRIAVLDLTAESHGNAHGVGILDFTTRRLFEKMDFAETYPNALTTTVPVSSRVPMVLASDRQAIQAAVKTANLADWSQARLARIRNTLSLDTLEVSPNVAAELKDHPRVTIEGEPYPLPFDAAGNLLGP